jgi:hypothetical protein
VTWNRPGGTIPDSANGGYLIKIIYRAVRIPHG